MKNFLKNVGNFISADFNFVQSVTPDYNTIQVPLVGAEIKSKSPSYHLGENPHVFGVSNISFN